MYKCSNHINSKGALIKVLTKLLQNCVSTWYQNLFSLNKFRLSSPSLGRLSRKRVLISCARFFYSLPQILFFSSATNNFVCRPCSANLSSLSKTWSIKACSSSSSQSVLCDSSSQDFQSVIATAILSIMIQFLSSCHSSLSQLLL
jgi:hypothetical protein